jgi:hypothetical protein
VSQVELKAILALVPIQRHDGGVTAAFERGLLAAFVAEVILQGAEQKGAKAVLLRCRRLEGVLFQKMLEKSLRQILRVCPLAFCRRMKA